MSTAGPIECKASKLSYYHTGNHTHSIMHVCRLPEGHKGRHECHAFSELKRYARCNFRWPNKDTRYSMSFGAYLVAWIEHKWEQIRGVN